MKLRILAAAVAVFGVMLLASVALAKFPDQGVGQGSSDIWVANLHESEDANVVASYVDQDGNPDDTVGATLDPLGNTSFPASSAGVGNDWLGSMVLYSDKELASAAQLYYQNVPRADGWSGAAYRGYSEGSSEILVPGVAKTQYHRSIITVQCVDTVDCPVWMTYRDLDGNVVAGSPYTDNIEPDSQETYDLHDATLNPNIPALPTTWFGSMQVTSTQEIAGVVVTHWTAGYALANNALVPGTDTQLYFASVNRRNFNGTWGGQSDWTGFSVQNLSAEEITVYVSLYSLSDGLLKHSFSDTIPASSNHQYNMRYCGNIPACSEAFLDSKLGTVFLGTAIVTSEHPIVGAASGERMASKKMAGGYLGVSGGTDKLVYPVVYRTKNGTKWTGYTSVSVQNVDPNNDVDVTVKFMNSNGTVGLQFGDTIPANSLHGYSTRYGGNTPGGASAFDVLGTSWSGSVIVTTDDFSESITGVAASEIHGTGYAYMGVYNAVD